jgi:hypothetical protein
MKIVDCRAHDSTSFSTVLHLSQLFVMSNIHRLNCPTIMKPGEITQMLATKNAGAFSALSFFFYFAYDLMSQI